jgi:hypothetical protein
MLLPKESLRVSVLPYLETQQALAYSTVARQNGNEGTISGCVFCNCCAFLMYKGTGWTTATLQNSAGRQTFTVNQDGVNWGSQESILMPAIPSTMRRLGALLTALVLGLTLTAPLAADTLLTKRRDADEMTSPTGAVSPGAKNLKVEIWIGPDRVRRDGGPTSLLLRLDQRKLYFINNPAKTYTVTDLRQEGGRWVSDFASSLPQGHSIPKAALDEMRKVWLLSAKAEPTGETRKIGSWQATRFKIAESNQAGTGQRIQLDWWIAPDLHVEDGPLRALMRLLAGTGMGGDAWLDTVFDLPGYPVLFERKQQQPEVEVKTREELVSVEQREPPAGIYEPPAGYRLLVPGDYKDLYGWPGPL